MAQVLVRNLDDDVLLQLKRKAAQEGLSLEAFLRERLVREAATPSKQEILTRIDAIRARSRPARKGEMLAEDIIRSQRDARTKVQEAWLSTPASRSNGSSKKKARKPRAG